MVENGKQNGLHNGKHSSNGLRKLRVCVLHPSTEGCISDFTTAIDPVCSPSVYDVGSKYVWHDAHICKARAGRQLLDLSKQGFDVYLNLCDGAFDEDRAGIDVIYALERLVGPPDLVLRDLALACSSERLLLQAGPALHRGQLRLLRAHRQP